MTEEQLDDFFRKAAEQYDIPYNPHAWDKMKRQLDPPGRSGGFFTRRRIIGLALLLLLAGGVGIGYHQRGDEPLTSSTTPSAGPSASSILREAPQEKTATQPRVSVHPESPAEVAPAGNLPHDRLPPANRRTRAAAAAAVAKPSSATLISTNRSIRTTRPVTRQPKVSFLPVLRDINPPIPSGPSPVAVADLSWPQENTVDPAPTFPRYGLSVGVSPDLSSVRLGKVSGVGRKVTLQFEYFLSRKWSLVTGGMLSHKTYAASGESYRPYPGYWDRYPLPDKINGQCNVLDIPLNVKYYAVSFDRSRWFISSGLSSYLMLQEEYEYIYPQDNYERYEKNTNQHYFKVANLSVGYDRTLGRRWAIQVEPFVKLPLTGVGFGHIHLTTVGTVFSLHYRGAGRR